MANLDKVRALLGAELKRKLSDKPRLPFSAHANYEYEGDLKNGGISVEVPVSPKINMTAVNISGFQDIRDAAAQDITASNRTITSSTLTIDHLHQYLEKVGDLEEIETLYSIKGNRTSDLVNAMNTQIEKSIIAMLDATMVANPSQVYTPTGVSAANIATHIMKLRTMLSEKEVGFEDRILIVNPTVSALIAQAQILSATSEGAKSAIEGWLGKFAGFSVYESNLMTNNGNTTGAVADCYGFKSKSYNYVRQLYKAKVTEAEKGMYYNILAQIAHGGKVFDQNVEQIVKMEATLA